MSRTLRAVGCARAGSAAALALLSLLLGIGPGCRSSSSGATHFDPRAPRTRSLTNLFEVGLSNRFDPGWLDPPRVPYRLGPGDRVDIEVLGEGEGPAETFVGPDGRIYFHLLPGLQVWGLSLEETRRLIEERVAEFVRDPQVAITLREVRSKRVWVLGRVNTPGLYPLTAPMTIIEAITRAGGLFTSRFSGTTEELADLHHSFLIRDGRMLPIRFHELLREGDTSQNIYLEPDDFLYLPSSLSSEVYVLGAVYQPRAVAFKDQVTLVSAIANARGTVENAWLGHVAIVRGSLTEPRIAIVDYDAIVKGRATDVRLEARDIVYVPLAPYRSLENYANLIVNTFVRTIAANEGGRAANPNYQRPGVTIPISQ
ncbi:MAG: polysaccharide biosynthesis/export family protein [Verrucomicrobiales bacterium]|nr:polysaccharide biosynthesis/export family protein [Verrucomicrobiales bacterium]MCP5526691.1 polysaccharide biosynthesis/export family protein [Verrucomicrobiales bacterium]